LLISMIVLSLVGCDSLIDKNSSLYGNTKIVKNDYDKPLSNAVVSIDEHKGKTDEEGNFKVTNLKSGTYEVNVLINQDGSEINSLSDDDNEEIPVLTKEVNLSPGDNNLDLEVTPKVTVLKYDQESWQLAFYAHPPAGKKITGGTIYDPEGNEYEMEQYFDTNSMHKWWNIYSPMSGNYKYELKYDDESEDVFEVYIAEEDFNINLPDLIYPEDDSVIKTTTPTFEFENIENPERIYLRLEEWDEENNDWIEKDWILIDNENEYTVEDGILQKGNKYRWSIQPIYKAEVFAWTEAKARYKIFEITDD
ncbi:MAG: MSCRAMM family protein, partial [Nanoarchaeota archaeon]